MSRIKALFSIYLIAAIDNCGYAMVFVLFPMLILRPEYGFLPHHPSFTHKLLAVGALYAAFPLAQLIGAPLIGELADRFGRKRIFYFSITATALTYFATGAILNIKSIPLLLLARAITGLFSGNLGLCNASIADLSAGEKRRARNYGILAVIWGISFPLALILGGFFSDPSLSHLFTPALPFYIAGGLSCISLITLDLFFPQTRKPKRTQLHLAQGIKNIIDAIRNRRSARFFILMLIWTLGWGFSVSWYSVFTIRQFGLSQEVVTVGLMIQGLGWAFGGAIVKPLLLQLLKVKQIAKLSYGATAILLLIAALMPTFPFFLLVYTLSAISAALALSSTFSLISLSAPATSQGKTMGIAQSMLSFGSFLAPLLGAAVGALSLHTFYPISALFLFLGLTLLLMKKS